VVAAELGNEVYDFHAFLPMFPNATAYLQWVAPLLKARGPITRMSVPVPPCPSFYNEACWGGPQTLLAAWYDNISTVAKRSAGALVAGSSSFGAVTAHHYRPTVHEINCTLTGGCMYAGNVGLSSQLSSRATNLTDNDFASVMMVYPSVTLGAAARAWRRDFPGRQLLITEFEMQWPSYSPPLDDSPVGRFVHNAVNSGSHACFYAAAILAALDSGGVIGSINHHALGAGEPGWGLMDLTPKGGVGFNAVAQMMSHLSALATESHTSAHRVNVSGGVTLGPLVVDSVKDLPGLQAAALSDGVGSGGVVLLVLNRAQSPVACTVDLGLLPSQSDIRAGEEGEEGESVLVGRTVSYLAGDRGGWFTVDAAAAAAPLPWPGPMQATVRPLRLTRRRKQVEGSTSTWAGLTVPALSFTIVELSALPVA
jgi:hypothetical protein